MKKLNTRNSIERTEGALGKSPRYGNLKGKALELKMEEERALYYGKKYGAPLIKLLKKKAVRK